MKVLRPERCVILDGKPCPACTEDIELEKEIYELKSRIEEIHIRRRALRTAMNKNHDPFIHKFPPEIASQIFIQYSLPRACNDKSDRTRQLYLGAVCQKWRQLAWATPQLWTSLYFEHNGRYKHDLPQLLNEWLERSASLPLTIRYVDGWGRTSEGDEVTAILNKHSARWCDMQFDLPMRVLGHLYGSPQVNTLRRLALEYTFAREHVELSDFSTFSMKNKASPAELSLTRVGLAHVDILWNNLTVASLNDLDVLDCLEIIRRAPLLKTLTLHSVDSDRSSDVFPIPNRMFHPRLHSLELVEIWDETALTLILDSLCLPSLERWIHEESCFLFDSMMSFGCLSPCLKHLTIGIRELEYHQLIQFLSRLSSLECLRTTLAYSQQNKDHAELFDLLCFSAKSPLFLPHLQSLEFIWDWFPWKLLPQIFTPSCWQSLRVKVDTSRTFHWHEVQVDVETAKLLLELVDKGVDLRISRHGQDDLLQKYKKAWLRYSTGAT